MYLLKRMINQFHVFLIFLSYDRFYTQYSQNLLSLLTLISPKDAQCSETNEEPNFRLLWILVYEICLILWSKLLVNSGLRRLCASTDWEPDSDTLTRNTWWPVGYSMQKHPRSGSGAPLTYFFFAPILMFYFCRNCREKKLCQKRAFAEKKNCRNFFRICFKKNCFLIVLESSETHFDLVASKIRAKLNNLVILWPFLKLF